MLPVAFAFEAVGASRPVSACFGGLGLDIVDVVAEDEAVVFLSEDADRLIVSPLCFVAVLVMIDLDQTLRHEENADGTRTHLSSPSEAPPPLLL